MIPSLLIQEDNFDLLRRYREALEFYAKGQHRHSAILCDCEDGAKAREALEEDE